MPNQFFKRSSRLGSGSVKAEMWFLIWFIKCVRGFIRYRIQLGYGTRASLSCWRMSSVVWFSSTFLIIDTSEFGRLIAWFSSFQFGHSVMSNSLQPHGLQHISLPCPSPNPELISSHVYQVGDAIQPSHPLLSPSSPAFNLSQHQGLVQWVSSLHQVTKSASVPPMNIQDWFPLGWTDLISLQSNGLSRVFSNITIKKRQFFTTQLSLWSNSHIYTWLLEKP